MAPKSAKCKMRIIQRRRGHSVSQLVLFGRALASINKNKTMSGDNLRQMADMFLMAFWGKNNNHTLRSWTRPFIASHRLALLMTAQKAFFFFYLRSDTGLSVIKTHVQVAPDLASFWEIFILIKDFLILSQNLLDLVMRCMQLKHCQNKWTVVLPEVADFFFSNYF